MSDASSSNKPQETSKLTNQESPEKSSSQSIIESNSSNSSNPNNTSTNLSNKKSIIFTSSANHIQPRANSISNFKYIDQTPQPVLPNSNYLESSKITQKSQAHSDHNKMAVTTDLTNNTEDNNTNSNNVNADFSDGINALEAALSQIDSLVKEQQEKENNSPRNSRKNSVLEAEKAMRQLENQNPFKRPQCDW